MSFLFGGLVVSGIAYYYYCSKSNESDESDDSSEEEKKTMRLASVSPKRHMEWTLPETKVATAKKIEMIFNKPLKEDPNASPFIDIVRLARRVTLTMEGQIVDLGEDHVGRLVSALSGTTVSLAQESMQNVALFHALQEIGFESRTTAVLKGLHQGILMPISFALKAHTLLLTKDKEWTIDIVVDGPQTTVRHRRVEASFGTTDEDRFDVETVTTLTLTGTTLEHVDTTMQGLPRCETLSSIIVHEFTLLSKWNAA